MTQPLIPYKAATALKTGVSMYAARHHRRSNQAGFLLIEILVTVVIVSLGLLGVAAMQFVGLQSNNRATERGMATILAYDVIDRMRANSEAAHSGQYALDPDNLPTSPAYDCQSVFPSPNTHCEANEMAASDLAEWQFTLNNLPGGTARITCVDQAGAACTGATLAPTFHTITIIWDDARTGATGTGCDPDNSADMLCMAMDLQL
ncbi:MAG: type IV pilus modification protein PilV [Nevskiales bacterium]